MTVFAVTAQFSFVGIFVAGAAGYGPELVKVFIPVGRSPLAVVAGFAIQDPVFSLEGKSCQAVIKG